MPAPATRPYPMHATHPSCLTSRRPTFNIHHDPTTPRPSPASRSRTRYRTGSRAHAPLSEITYAHHPLLFVRAKAKFGCRVRPESYLRDRGRRLASDRVVVGGWVTRYTRNDIKENFFEPGYKLARETPKFVYYPSLGAPRSPV